MAVLDFRWHRINFDIDFRAYTLILLNGKTKRQTNIFFFFLATICPRLRNNKVKIFKDSLNHQNVENHWFLSRVWVELDLYAFLFDLNSVHVNATAETKRKMLNTLLFFGWWEKQFRRLHAAVHVFIVNMIMSAYTWMNEQLYIPKRNTC